MPPPCQCPEGWEDLASRNLRQAPEPAPECTVTNQAPLTVVCTVGLSVKCSDISAWGRGESRGHRLGQTPLPSPTLGYSSLRHLMLTSWRAPSPALPSTESAIYTSPKQMPLQEEGLRVLFRPPFQRMRSRWDGSPAF